MNDLGSLLQQALSGNYQQGQAPLQAYGGSNDNILQSLLGFGKQPNETAQPKPQGFLGDLSGSQKLGVGIQAGSALLNGFMGMKQYGLAKDQLKFQKTSFNKNYQNQVGETNRRLEDRQAARVASNPGAYQSVSDYMNRYRVS